MFEFLFSYPVSVFRRGDFVLLGSWPAWVLPVLIAAAAAGLGLLMRWRVAGGNTSLRGWRAGAVWLLQSALVALVLVLLWRPAISIAELRPQQNIIAVLVDGSRSMAITDEDGPRRDRAVTALEDGVLDRLREKFQTRLYRVDDRLTRVQSLEEVPAASPATRIGDSLRQLAEDTADLPLGAVVLLSDGGDNAGGIGLDAISALRSRRVPVYTVGLGAEQVPNDVEITDATVVPRAVADSRLAARVSFQQRGYAGRKAMLRVRDEGRILTAREITFAGDGDIQTESVLFNAGTAGAKALQFSIDVQPAETNEANNAVTRLVNVESARRRILYVEGEPRWEYKFIRRAEDEDRIVHLVSMLRTTENKIYRQGIERPEELAEGFPSTAEELFEYQGLIIGSVEAGYFTQTQQDLIRQFVDRRGGGLLLLGGRYSLGDGGWAASPLADLLPVVLPDKRETFRREPATVELTPAGMDSIIVRIEEDTAANAERWKKLPYLMNYQEIGTPKPGAATLAEMTANGRRMPLLVTQNYGRGRTAVLATSGTWRWQMLQPAEDQSHEAFWRQLLRWLVSDTPGRVITSIPNQILFDQGRVEFSADVRDKTYQPVSDAQVEARIVGPAGIGAQVEMTPEANATGVFRGEWEAEQPGSYLIEVTASRGGEEIGRDVLTFQRVDGVAEHFRTGQNVELLRKLAAETGGRYMRPGELSSLPDEISYSEAGITVRETKELWHMPAVFLMILLLRSSEWLLRRKWGVV